MGQYFGVCEIILALLSFECQSRYLSEVVALCAGPERTLMKFRSLHDRVVIRRSEGDLKSKGGIIIPDTAKEKPQEGEVIVVGPVRVAKAVSSCRPT
jgi:hypothetical protein